MLVKEFRQSLMVAWYDLLECGILSYTDLQTMRVNDIYQVWRIAKVRGKV
jgi:hypothetical protein